MASFAPLIYSRTSDARNWLNFYFTPDIGLPAKEAVCGAEKTGNPEEGAYAELLAEFGTVAPANVACAGAENTGNPLDFSGFFDRLSTCLPSKDVVCEVENIGKLDY